MSRYLLDENLPATLVSLVGGDCRHAAQIAVQPTDEALWQAARKEAWTILTKDADFFQRILLEGPPPKVVWFRTGNLRRMELEQLVARIWPSVETLLVSATWWKFITKNSKDCALGPTDRSPHSFTPL